MVVGDLGGATCSGIRRCLSFSHKFKEKSSTCGSWKLLKDRRLQRPGQHGLLPEVALTVDDAIAYLGLAPVHTYSHSDYSFCLPFDHER